MSCENFLGHKGSRTITGEIAQSQSRLALHLQARAIHEHHKTGNQFRFALSELLPIGAYQIVNKKKLLRL